LKADWQRHVLASSGYLELGMFDAAALVLEEIAPDDKNRMEVLGARVNLYMAAKKWDMAAAVASHLVKVDPKTAGWWISLAYALRRTEGVEKAKAILLRQAIHPEVAMIAFNLACGMPSSLIKRRKLSIFSEWRSPKLVAQCRSCWRIAHSWRTRYRYHPSRYSAYHSRMRWAF
jgi:tetratricopeptide (TPR) repeat protein